MLLVEMLCKSGKGEKQYTENMHMPDYHDFDIVEQFLKAGAAVKYPVPLAIFSQQERQDATHQLIY